MKTLFLRVKLFSGILFEVLFSCASERTLCEHPIHLNGNYKCYSRQKLIESEIYVRCDSSFEEGLFRNKSESVSGQSRTSSVFLAAYPVLVKKTKRYKAHFCVDVLSKDMVDISFISLIFSMRQEREGSLIPISEVHYYVKEISDSIDDSIIRIGCFWHSDILLAINECTVKLRVTISGDGFESYANFYFRIPDWEAYNNQVDVDPCLFPPFVYVVETEEWEIDSVIIRPVVCSRRVVLEVERRMESSGEVSATERVLVEGMRRINFKSYPNEFHYYQTLVKDIEVPDELDYNYTIIIPSLTVLLIAMVLAFWYFRKFRFAKRKEILYLKTAPRVQFKYSKGEGFEIFRRQSEILITFMETHCNIMSVNDSHQPQGISQITPLRGDSFDILVVIPFFSAGRHSDITCDSETIDVIESSVNTKACVILELPFWSRSHKSFKEMYFTNKGLRKKWKHFKLMDEFLPFVRYLHKGQLGNSKKFRSPINAEQMQQKLDECNLTNEGFLFCLDEIYSHDTIAAKKSYSINDFPNLHDIVI